MPKNWVAGQKRPARHERTGIDDIKIKYLVILNETLGAATEKKFSFDLLRSKQLLLVSFPNMRFPNSHVDESTNDTNQYYRILWDFHLRGRILSVVGSIYGVFLENCRVEICSRKICDINPMQNNVKVTHQGWDCNGKDLMVMPC